jgi:hypothetical protein
MESVCGEIIRLASGQLRRNPGAFYKHGRRRI